MPKPKQKRLFAEPVSEIVSLNTGAVVGWIYRWNNGDLQTAWLCDPQSQVLSQPLPSQKGD